MSIHINAKVGEIAEDILLPGDPLRAKHIAELYLENYHCHNQIRGMYGFTGYYKGKKISIQGTGMGIPSVHIYINELIQEYKCKNLIRIGTFGSITEKVKCKDVMLVNGASTDSEVNNKRFGFINYAPTASFDLLTKAKQLSESIDLNVSVGGILTGDIFYKTGDYYDDSTDLFQKLSGYGIYGSDMETSELYTLAAKFGCKALSILTCSDELITGIETAPEEREKTFDEMVQLALETLVNK